MKTFKSYVNEIFTPAMTKDDLKKMSPSKFADHHPDHSDRKLRKMAVSHGLDKDHYVKKRQQGISER